jgi:hypothetical protein
MRKPRELSSAERRTLARIGALMLAACVSFGATRVKAATVALLRPDRDAPALNEALFRLDGELLAIGASVTILDGPADRDADSAELRGWLELTARERAIDAYIDVVGGDTPVAANVWLCERSPLRLRRSRVELEPNANDRAATLAIRAIEVLRSSFLARELSGAHQADTRVESAPMSNETAPPPQPLARLGIEAGATALASFGEVSPAVLALARVDWALGSWFSLQATAAGLGSRPRIETPAGHVDVARQFGLMGLCLCSPKLESIRPLFALSAGAIRTELFGAARPPNAGHQVEQWAALVDADFGARVGLPARVYLTLTAHVQIAAPSVTIHVMDTVVATTGRPNVLFTLTAGVRP